MSRHDPILRDGLIVIRPSTTVGWPDCALRTAARAYRDMFVERGYEVRQPITSAGAAVGTAVHAGAAFTLQAKVDTGAPGANEDAEEIAVMSLRDEIRDGANWDDATPRANDGEKQVRRMVAEYRRTVAPKIKPIMVEKRLEADLGDGFLNSGQADSLALEPGSIRDLKTGAERIHIPQLGDYSLLARANGLEVTRLVEDFIPRVKTSYAQPEAIEISYPVDFAEQVAQHRLRQMMRDLSAFRDTGDAMVFPANPSSMLCSPKYCPVHGTSTCRQHRGAFQGAK